VIAYWSPARIASWSQREGLAVELIEQWYGQGVQGVAIHAALICNHVYRGHDSSVRRVLSKLKGRRIDATMILEFAPGEAAQVDFGAGPMVMDPVSAMRGAPRDHRQPKVRDHARRRRRPAGAARLRRVRARLRVPDQPVSPGCPSDGSRQALTEVAVGGRSGCGLMPADVEATRKVFLLV
jgi:hypothetical protein